VSSLGRSLAINRCSVVTTADDKVLDDTDFDPALAEQEQYADNLGNRDRSHRRIHPA
jgi:hypothetical protein